VIAAMLLNKSGCPSLQILLNKTIYTIWAMRSFNNMFLPVETSTTYFSTKSHTTWAYTVYLVSCNIATSIAMGAFFDVFGIFHEDFI
jgi:hypothetical protein